MATIYILEDDLNIQEIEAYALKNSGYQTEGFDNAREFFKKGLKKQVDRFCLPVFLSCNPEYGASCVHFMWSCFCS